MLMVGLLLLVGSQAVQAQKVKIKLDESTFGISARTLQSAANGIIQKRFGSLKAKSWQVQGNMELVSEDYAKNSLNYKMTVIFLHKKTYTAEVKTVRFSIVNGQTKNVSITAAPLRKLRVIRKIPVRLSCKMKQGLIIKPIGKIGLDKIRAIRKKPGVVKKTQMRTMDLKKSVVTLRKAELSLLKWWYAKGLATTPCDTIPTAVSGTKDVYNTFGTAFGKGYAAMRLGKSCTVNAVSAYLKYDSKLLAWNHIGHGWPGGIVLWGSSLTAATVQGLKPHRGLWCAVVLINSCNTFKDPLKAAFLSNKPRTFIAGAISLPIGPSEKVDMCFWKAVLLKKIRMDRALATCSKKYNLTGAFGLAGDGGRFWL